MSTPIVLQSYISKEMEFGSSMNGSRKGIVLNATSETVAIATALANAIIFPTTMNVTLFSGSPVTFVRDRANAREIADGNSDGPTTWEVTVNYVMLGLSQQPYTPGDQVTTFEIGSENKHIIHNPRRLTNSYVAGGTAPDFKHFIGIDNGGNVSGVDITYPTFAFSETHIFLDSDVTTDYVNGVYNVANNPINDDTFRDLDAYSVKFLGMQGSRRFNGGDWELNFRFAAQPNATGLQIDDITGILLTGWQYLWTWTVPSVGNSGSIKFPVPTAKSVQVETIYGESDFSALGIGT